jgi:hypothetical protein
MIDLLEATDEILLAEFGSFSPVILSFPHWVLPPTEVGLIEAKRLAGSTLAFPGESWALSAIGVSDEQCTELQLLRAWADPSAAGVELQQWENLLYCDTRSFAIPATVSDESYLSFLSSPEFRLWFDYAGGHSNLDLWNVIYKIVQRFGFCAAALSESAGGILVAAKRGTVEINPRTNL